jgi:hydroxyacylglutathione hydrolase/adenylyltransferase/sulfurtransferase
VSSADSAQIEVPPEIAAELLARGAQFIDVREGYEREAGYIAGTRHIELERLASQAATIERDRPVVFQCRSAMAAKAFRADGYDAYTLTGGLMAWVAAGLPIEPDGGHVADH